LPTGRNEEVFVNLRTASSCCFLNVTGDLGDIVQSSIFTDSQKKLFLNKVMVDKDNKCWIMPYNENPSLTPRIFGRDARMVSWEIFSGEEFPSESIVSTICQVRSCVNPKHIIPAELKHKVQIREFERKLLEDSPTGIYKIKWLFPSIYERMGLSAKPSSYIGMSSNIYNRYKIHLAELKKQTHYNGVLQEYYDEFGEDGFALEFLEYASNPKYRKFRESIFIWKNATCNSTALKGESLLKTINEIEVIRHNIRSKINLESESKKKVYHYNREITSWL